MNKFLLICIVVLSSCTLNSPKAESVKPRILISTDIGGTDADDFQSMIHFLMYSNQFDTEGIVSSPSFGNGSTQDIYDMIDLYEKDFSKLTSNQTGFPTADSLRSLCKQGKHGNAPFKGYSTATEGSNWIVECARRESDQPLWILGWGGLEDLAQALHDAPDIQDKIRVYWIGGPNKKWSANSYAYIVENFPNLWFIENNASYRGFISDNKLTGKFNKGYYAECIQGAGALGENYINHYEGNVKMGDTPSLLYTMNGDLDNPEGESWGGSFEKLAFSPRIIFSQPTTIKDSVPTYSVLEFHIKGPEINISPDSACFTMTVDKQDWDGFYLGNGHYVVRYIPKAPATLDYKIVSDIPNFPQQEGVFVVANIWPGIERENDYKLGDNWYTDKQDPALFEKGWQGSKTVSAWRNDVLSDWEKRWAWLK